MSEDETFYVPMLADEEPTKVNPKKKGKKQVAMVKDREVEW